MHTIQFNIEWILLMGTARITSKPVTKCTHTSIVNNSNWRDTWAFSLIELNYGN